MEWFLFAFLSAIAVAIGVIINKKILSHEHATEFSASRGVFIIFVLLFILPFVDFNISWYSYLLIYVVSIIESAGIIYYLKSIRHGELSYVYPLMNLSPLFLLVFAFLILGEIPSPQQYIGVFLIIVGAYSLQVGIGKKGFFEPIKMFLKSKVIHFMLFAIIIFALTGTFDKLIITKYSGFLTYFFLINLFKSVNYIIVESYRFGFRELMADVKKDFKLLASTSILLAIGQIAYYFALSFTMAPVSLVTPIRRTSTLFATIFGGRLFHEGKLLVKTLACIIMVWGVVFIIL